jgi:hypothetical protein
MTEVPRKPDRPTESQTPPTTPEVFETPATPGTPGLPGDPEPGAPGAMPAEPPAREQTPLQLVAWIVAGVFALIGVLGFVPGVTTNYDELSFAGHESGAMLLGLFQVSILHNIVHLLFALVGFALARTASGAYLYLVGGGVIYLILWVYGLIIDPSSAANFVPLNGADNWLHLALGFVMVAVGVVAGRTIRQPSRRH